MTWKTPRKLSAVEVAFPANALDFMPPYEEIPDEFKRNRDSKWLKLQSDSFYYGVKNLKVEPQEGINVADALACLQAINGSYEPKHEHKQAAFAYLASLWFKNATWERAKEKL